MRSRPGIARRAPSSPPLPSPVSGVGSLCVWLPGESDHALRSPPPGPHQLIHRVSQHEPAASVPRAGRDSAASQTPESRPSRLTRVGASWRSDGQLMRRWGRPAPRRLPWSHYSGDGRPDGSRWHRTGLAAARAAADRSRLRRQSRTAKRARRDWSEERVVASGCRRRLTGAGADGSGNAKTDYREGY